MTKQLEKNEEMQKLLEKEDEEVNTMIIKSGRNHRISSGRSYRRSSKTKESIEKTSPKSVAASPPPELSPPPPSKPKPQPAPKSEPKSSELPQAPKPKPTDRPKLKSTSSPPPPPSQPATAHHSGGDSDDNRGDYSGGDSYPDSNSNSDSDSDHSGGDAHHSGGVSDSNHSGRDAHHDGGDYNSDSSGWETISEEDSNESRVLIFEKNCPLSSSETCGLNNLKKRGRGGGGRCLGKRLPSFIPIKDCDYSDFNFFRSPSSKPQGMTLTLFALQLAVIKKLASGLGKLSFVWATVVILGGLGSDLKPKDFWFITTILLIQGVRIFTHSRELEWLHQSRSILPANTSSHTIQSYLSIRLRSLYAFMPSLSFASRLIRQQDGIASLPVSTPTMALQSTQPLPTQNRNPVDVPLLHDGWIFVMKYISCLLYWLQILTTTACIVLSLMRLRQQDYGDAAQINKKSALNAFYSLALIEAIMLLLEKLTWGIMCKKLIEQVSHILELYEDFDLNTVSTYSLHCFFYNAYSQCINGNIFDGLKMDLVSFAEKLLNSDYPNEHIVGARILKGLIKKEQFAANTLLKIGNSTRVVEKLFDSDSPDVQAIGAWIVKNLLKREQFANNTLRKIGNSLRSIERLIEMLKCENDAERKIASKIVLKLASSQHAALVTMNQGAMESIASLLIVTGYRFDNITKFNHIGLQILKHLAGDQEKCRMIVNAQGLLDRIINLTDPKGLREPFRAEPDLIIMIVSNALQLVKNILGHRLQRDILNNVSLMSNIRELLEGRMILLVRVGRILMEDGRILEDYRISAEYREKLAELQKLGLEILTILGSNWEGRERIGATGYMLSLIIKVFFRAKMHMHAGEALVMLICCRNNCERMLNEIDDVRRLLYALEDPDRMLHAMKILRGLCAYSAPDQSDRLQIVAEAMPKVLKKIVEEKEVLLESSIGLAIQMLKYINAGDFENKIENAGITNEQFVKRLVNQLQNFYVFCNTKRYVIELAIALMKYDGKYIELFRNLEMKQVLIRIAETKYEFQHNNYMSGGEGLSHNEVMIFSLVDTALKLLDEGSYSG